jgi:cysteine desulfurase family protein (TIGR01976 family)
VVIVTMLDHPANVAPWRAAARDAGAIVREVPFDPVTCTLEMDALRAALGPRTRLVAVGYASNALGTVNDVAEVARLAADVGALSFVDAVHFAPHGVLDVQAVGCDFLACSAYKFFGPHTGVLWGRRELLEGLDPYKVPPAADTAPERWETGTLNHEGIAGTAAAVEWIASLAPAPRGGWRERVVGGMRAIEALERPLLDRVLDGLSGLRRVRLHGPPAGHPRTPTVALTVDGTSAGAVSERLAREGIFVWDGDFYASTVIDHLGLRERGGVVRVGLAPYNTEEEVDRLLEALGRAAS